MLTNEFEYDFTGLVLSALWSLTNSRDSFAECLLLCSYGVDTLWFVLLEVVSLHMMKLYPADCLATGTS